VLDIKKSSTQEEIPWFPFYLFKTDFIFLVILLPLVSSKTITPIIMTEKTALFKLVPERKLDWKSLEFEFKLCVW